MKNIILKFSSLTLFIQSVFILSSALTTPTKVSIRMLNKCSAKNTLSMRNAEVFFQSDQNRLITRFPAPNDLFIVTNATGEGKIYDPKTLEVMNRNTIEYDAEKCLMYFFFVGKMKDMGLKDLGFTLTDSKFDDKKVITTWFPPSGLINTYGKVVLVHQDYKPVSVTFYDKASKLVKVINYSDFSSFSQFSMPTTVITKEYSAQGDSSISTITYSDVKVDDKANSSYFNFRIPVNAKVKN